MDDLGLLMQTVWKRFARIAWRQPLRKKNLREAHGDTGSAWRPSRRLETRNGLDTVNYGDLGKTGGLEAPELWKAHRRKTAGRVLEGSLHERERGRTSTHEAKLDWKGSRDKELFRRPRHAEK